MCTYFFPWKQQEWEKGCLGFPHSVSQWCIPVISSTKQNLFRGFLPRVYPNDSSGLLQAFCFQLREQIHLCYQFRSESLLGLVPWALQSIFLSVELWKEVQFHLSLSLMTFKWRMIVHSAVTNFLKHSTISVPKPGSSRLSNSCRLSHSPLIRLRTGWETLLIAPQISYLVFNDIN